MENKFYKIEIEIPREMDSDEAKTRLINAIYKTSVIFYEVIGEFGKLTDGKKLYGNGHHMAQEMAEKAGKLWDEHLTNK